MRTRHQYPKCSSTQVALLTGSSVFTSVDGRNSLVEKCTCTDCGFIEECLVDKKELDDLNRKYLKN
jgi:hypothetical protein